MTEVVNKKKIKNGELHSWFVLRNGKKHGFYIVMHPEPKKQIKSMSYWQNGVKVGHHFKYSVDGDHVYSRFYIDGKLKDVYIGRMSNGKHESVTKYDDHGFVTYHEVNGTIELFEYTRQPNGELLSKKTERYIDGSNLTFKEHWQKFGGAVAIETHHYTDGHLVSKVEQAINKLNKYIKTYEYSKNKLESLDEAVYQDDEMIARTKYTYSFGVPVSKIKTNGDSIEKYTYTGGVWTLV